MPARVRVPIAVAAALVVIRAVLLLPLPEAPAGAAAGVDRVKTADSRSTSGSDRNMAPSAQTAIYLPIANILAPGSSPLASLGTHEETSPAVALGGAWERVADVRASGGSYLVSRAPGASAEIVFGGDSIELLRSVDDSGGRVDVTVDEVHVGQVDFGFVEARWQVPAVIDHLGDGPHRLVLRVASDRPVYLDAFVLPSPHVPNADQHAALTRLNAHRARIGVAPARMAAAVNLGAQAHAEYDILHHGGHREIPGNPGFTGTSSSDRVSLFGLRRSCGEVMVGLGGPAAVVDFGPEQAVEFWLQSVYHRNPLLRYGVPVIGFGRAVRGEAEVVEADVLDLCEHLDPVPEARLIHTFPADGQTEVPLLFIPGTESPNPLPNHRGEVGYPVSLYIAQPKGPATGERGDRDRSNRPQRAQQAMRITTAEIRDPAGQSLPVTVLDATDPAGLIAPDEMFVIAEQPFRMNRRYSVHVAGSDSRGLPFDQRWSFTTQLATRIREVTVDAGACGVTIRWRSAGPTRAWVEYGTTADYGERVDDPQIQPAQLHTVRIEGIRWDTTYHYRIWVEDELGNRAATDDATFAITDPPLIDSVVIEPGACEAVVRWHMICELPTWVEYGPTNAYGTRISVPRPSTVQVLKIAGLRPETVYHYRIVAEDAFGNRVTTADAVFTTPQPRTWRVPEDVPAIDAAIRVAEACDTVQVAPGSYSGSFRIDAAIHLVGAGPGLSIIQADGYFSDLNLTADAEVRGFTITGFGLHSRRAAIQVFGDASPIIRNNRLVGNAIAISSYCNDSPCRGSPLIANNVIVGPSDCGICLPYGAPIIINNTIAENLTGINNFGTPTMVRNNIVTGNRNLGVARAVEPEWFRYNNVWGNGLDFAGGTPGPGSLSVDPNFVAPDLGDYHLAEDSLCRAAGDPDPAYNNPDGRRGDMGAYGGPWAEK
jgi:hypothetical protein